MKLFIDTGSVAEVEEIAAWGVLSGATTNPSLLRRRTATRARSSSGSASSSTARCRPRSCPTSPTGMVAEGRALAALHEHVVVKVPFSQAGLAATRELTSDAASA